LAAALFLTTGNPALGRKGSRLILKCSNPGHPHIFNLDSRFRGNDGKEHPMTFNPDDAEAHESAPAPDLPESPKGYRLLERLAHPESSVYRAEDLAEERTVAVKILVPHSARKDDAAETFFYEAKNVARLKHPNLVRGLDVGRVGESFYFASAFIRGESLAQRLARRERGRLTEKEALPVIRAAAEGLQGLFENGLVHRAVAPDKILLADGGGVFLADAGVARDIVFADPEAWVLAHPNGIAPEVAEGDPNADVRADLYALGCAWFEAILGAPPFRGATAADVLKMHMEAPIPEPRELDPRLSSATSRMILSLLAKDRDERPRTPQEFLAKLKSHPLIASAEPEVASSNDEDD